MKSKVARRRLVCRWCWGIKSWAGLQRWAVAWRPMIELKTHSVVGAKVLMVEHIMPIKTFI
jgi:hypothetical protein